jgi:hypothetical protein
LRGIRCKIYPTEGGIHVFQTPFTIQEHGEKIDPKGQIAIGRHLGNSSILKPMNCWKIDYNRRTNAPFVYQLALLEYHKLVKD